MAEELLMKSRFVSEAALEEKRKQRQSEWERVRQPEDPVECPEEEYDARSLFERLQEQKDKKQAEYDEQFKFKNMVRGLETDEVDFLSEVSKQQELLDRRRIIEDRRAILEYRDAVVRRASALEKELPDRSDKRAMAVAVTAAAAAPAAPAEAKLKPKPRPSQTQLLAGAVKRRSSSSNSTDEMTVPKRPRGGEGVATDSPATTASRELAGVAVVGRGGPAAVVVGGSPAVVVVGGNKTVAVLPGLGAYTESSDEDSSDDGGGGDGGGDGGGGGGGGGDGGDDEDRGTTGREDL
uniref:PSME3-interacting protein isoform X2 n=1 Tax=Petromyzon marinus TaxID=7757 RepID=A0AAJ7XHS2_PETMA|nr:PSME3-interacting protein isoform X2 [Petromyzon marinus]